MKRLAIILLSFVMLLLCGCKYTSPRFMYNDCIEVRSGFYTGAAGTITDWQIDNSCAHAIGYQIYVALPVQLEYQYIDVCEDDIRLRSNLSVCWRKGETPDCTCPRTEKDCICANKEEK